MKKGKERNSFLHCPTLEDLPPPPPGKIGWPWTEKTPQLPDTIYPVECKAYSTGMPSALCSLPKISIVTPSYNQGQFIEETIRSVLLQSYPNLEYIIIDGRSTDNSVEIIKKYEKWLLYWVSESDKGQSDAINKGWKKSTGEIVAWLNSDDFYLPNTFNIVAGHFLKNPYHVIAYGNCQRINEQYENLVILGKVPFDPYKFLYINYIPQPSLFVKKIIFEKVEYLDTNLHYIMDWDFCLRSVIILNKGEIGYIPKTLSCIRKHPGSKSLFGTCGFRSELLSVYKKLFASSITQDSMYVNKKRFKYYLFQNMGRRYYEQWDLNDARRLYFKAFCNNPFSLPKFLYNIIRTFLPKPLIKSYRVKGGFKFIRNFIRTISK